MSSLVAPILQRYLGDFLEGLSKENLKIQVLDGLLTQKNVRVRTAALQEMNLPVTVKSGVVDLLTVQLPSLGSLSTQATKIVLDHVFIVAGPGHAAQDEHFDEREHETKKRRLQMAEALKGDATVEEKDKNKPGWFGHSKIGKLAESMIQNLTLHVNQIHVRYEDVDAHGTPFAAGITLESLEAEAAGADWKTAVGQMVEGAFRKLVSLRDIAVYWDEGSLPLKFANDAEMAKQMSALVFNMGMKNPPLHDYILPPVSGSAKFTFNSNYEQSLRPQVDIAFGFEALAIRLQELQWQQLTHILDGVSGEMRGLHYRKLRPKQEPEENPRAWWSFAIGSVLMDVRQTNETRTWKWIENHARDRKQYVHLWYVRLKGNKKKGSWNQAQRILKREIVKRRTFEQLMSFRSIAESLFLRQRELVHAALKGLSNPFKKSKLEGEIMEINVGAMPNGEWLALRHELARAELGEDRFHQKHSNMQPDYVRRDISFALSGVSLQLLNSENPIVSLGLDTVAARYRGLEDGTALLRAELGSLQVVDWHSRVGQALTAVQPTAANDLGTSLVEFNLEIVPKGPRKIDVRARSLDIVFSIPLVTRIKDFFAAGGAADALQHLRQDAVSAAARALQEKTKIPTHIHLAIDAPNIVFCETFANWPHCARLIGGLGQLTLSSTEEGKFAASIVNIRAFLGYPALTEWQRPLLQHAVEAENDDEQWVAILEETSLDVDIRSIHGATRHSDTTVRITGRFTSVPHINVSESIVVDIVRVAVGLALTAIMNDREPENATLSVPIGATPLAPAPSSAAVEITLLMPSLEIMATSTDADRGPLTKLVLSGTELSVKRGFAGRVDVRLGVASLTASDCISQGILEAPKMVWTGAADPNAREHVVLHVISHPNGGAVEVTLDILQVNLAMQRETALEVLAFSQALALDIVNVIPPEFKSKKLANPASKHHNVGFTLTTAGVALTLLRGGNPFLLILVSATTVKLLQFMHHRHLELNLGALSVDDPLAVGPYCRVLATSGKRTVDLVVDTFEPASPDFPGHELAISARLSSIQFVFLSRLLQEASVYFSELDEMKQLIAVKAGQAATQAVRSQVQPRLNVSLAGVVLVVPASNTDANCFVARVDEIVMKAEPRGTMALQITSVRVESAEFLTALSEMSDVNSSGVNFANVRPILQEWSAMVTMTRSIGEQNWGVSPDLSIRLESSEQPVRLRLYVDQIALLFNVLEFNILEPKLVPSFALIEPIESDIDLDVTVNSMRQRFKASLPNTDDDLVVAVLPVWIRVHVSIGEIDVDFGGSGTAPLGSLQCQGLVLDVNAFDQVTVQVDLAQAHLKDARIERQLEAEQGDLNLLSTVDRDRNVFELRFRQARGELDDIGLHLGKMIVMLDPSWLLGLFNVILPVLDRMLSIREKLECVQDGDNGRGEDEIILRRARERAGKVGMHLLLNIDGPQVSSLERSKRHLSRAVGLSSSLVTLERTEALDGSWAMDLTLHNVELWKSRFGTDERAAILFPVTVSIAWEEIPQELASQSVSVGAMIVDFSYQDLILANALSSKWLRVWGAKGEKGKMSSSSPENMAPVGKGNDRSIDNEDDLEDGDARGGNGESDAPALFRLELASNRALVADVDGMPPELSLQRRSDMAIQKLSFVDGRVVFEFHNEARWCVTVEGPPHSQASISVSQSHPGKAAAQLWDWLPVIGASGMGRLVLRSHPAWCLAVNIESAVSGMENSSFELAQTSEDSAHQLWHIPPRIAHLMPAASPAPLDGGVGGGRSGRQSPGIFGAQRLGPQKLVVPDRWAKKTPPAAQKLAIHLTAGLKVRIVDDSAGNVRPIVRLSLDDTSLEVSNWDNGGDLHSVFLIRIQADYFNEESEAWEPLLRGVESIGNPYSKEKSLDLQISVARVANEDAPGLSSLRASAMTSQAVSITVSRALVPTAIRLLEAWDNSKAEDDGTPISRPTPLPPRLLNQTGQTLFWRGMSGLTPGQAGELAVNASADMFPIANEKGVVGLRIGNGRWLTCPMDSVTSHIFRLDDGLTAVVDVDKRNNGGREVMVRSNVVVRNLTDHPLVLVYGSEEVLVKAGGSNAVPFDGLHVPLKLCPDPGMYKLSDKDIFAGTLLQQTPEQDSPGDKYGSVRTLRVSKEVFRCEHTLGGASWTWAVETRGKLSDSAARAWTWEIICRPPLTLRNLLHANTFYRILTVGKSKGEGDHETLFEGELERSESVQLHRVGLVDSLWLQIKVGGYLWSTLLRLGGSSPSTGTKLRAILLDHVREGGARTVSMYASYWLVNDAGAPCTWYDAGTKKPIPGQAVRKESASTSSAASPASLSGPPATWYKADDELYREPLLFWEDTKLIFRVGKGPMAAQSGVLKLGGKVGAVGAMSVEGPNRSLLEYGLQVFDAPGEFWRTKVVQLSNRFMLVNVSGRPLVYGQMDAAQEFPLAPGSQVPYHWAAMMGPKLIRVRFDDGDWGWSGGFSLQDASLFEVMLREANSLQSCRLVVQSVTDGPTTAILFHSAEGRTPMYSIRNHTTVPLLVKQVGVYDVGEEVPPNTTVPFAWADPSAAERSVQVLPVAGSKVELETLSVPRYSMDEVATLVPFKVFKEGWKAPLRCRVSLSLSGATKVLSIEDMEVEEDIDEEDFEVVGSPVHVEMALLLTLPGVSISFVSGTPNEIFHAWLDSIQLELESGELQKTLELNVVALQIDNQLQNKVYDTVVWGAAVEQKPFFHLAVNLGSGNSGAGMQFFNGIEVVVQELNVSLDEAFVTHSLQAAYDLISYLDRSMHQEIVRSAPDYTSLTLTTSDMVYARLLFFGPVRVILSYSSCPWGAASLKGDVVEKMLTLLGPVSGLERAALQLNSLRLDNAYATRLNMVRLISQHYKQAASSKLLLLLGSAHFIGSPITLVESIGTGFWDLWYEPVLGLTHSPQAFAEGMERGTRSMLSKTVYGIAKSASDLTGSFGNLTAQLSFDPRYIEGRERERKQQAQHVGEGLAYGAWDFGKGIFDGVTGLVTRPVTGAQQDGAVGFFKGVGQALSGVVVKPIAGTFGMVSRITEGVKNSANRATRVGRVRLPRFIGSDGVIGTYDGQRAEGQEILWRLSDGAYQTEFYVFHYPPLSALSYAKQSTRITRILASNRHLFYIKGLECGLMQVAWKCSLLSIESLQRSETQGLLVQLKSSPPIVLKAPAFYSYELTYVTIFLTRLVREAQGRRVADQGQWLGDVSVPELNELKEGDDAGDDFQLI